MNVTLIEAYASNPVDWGERQRMYRHFIGSYAVFFVLIGLINIGSSTNLSFAYAAANFVTVLPFAIALLLRRASAQSVFVGLIVAQGLFVQAVNPVEHAQGLVAAILAGLVLYWLGGFRRRPILKFVIAGAFTIGTVAFSAYQTFQLPSVDQRDVWTVAAYTVYWIAMAYQAVWSVVRPALMKHRAFQNASTEVAMLRAGIDTKNVEPDHGIEIAISNSTERLRKSVAAHRARLGEELPSVRPDR